MFKIVGLEITVSSKHLHRKLATCAIGRFIKAGSSDEIGRTDNNSMQTDQ